MQADRDATRSWDIKMREWCQLSLNGGTCRRLIEALLTRCMSPYSITNPSAARNSALPKIDKPRLRVQQQHHPAHLFPQTLASTISPWTPQPQEARTLLHGLHLKFNRKLHDESSGLPLPLLIQSRCCCAFLNMAASCAGQVHNYYWVHRSPCACARPVRNPAAGGAACWLRQWCRRLLHFCHAAGCFSRTPLFADCMPDPASLADAAALPNRRLPDNIFCTPAPPFTAGPLPMPCSALLCCRRASATRFMVPVR